MAQPSIKVEFIAGKLNETPTGGATVTILNAITDALANATEASGAMKFNLAASAVDIPLSMGNVGVANALFLLTDGAVNVKLNGDTINKQVNKTLVWFGTISGIVASNPSSSEVRAITLYAATISD